MTATTASSSVVLVTRDRVFGEALALAGRRYGLVLQLADPGALDGSVDGVIDLDQVDAGLSVQEFAVAVVDGSGLLRRDAPSSPGPARLTEREQQICRELTRGGSRAEVAAALGISEHTVRTHLQNIFAKLGVRDRAELVAWTFATNGHEPSEGV